MTERTRAWASLFWEVSGRHGLSAGQPMPLIARLAERTSRGTRAGVWRPTRLISSVRGRRSQASKPAWHEGGGCS